MLCSTGFEIISFLCFCKSELLWTIVVFSFKNKELLTKTKNGNSFLYSSVSWNSVQNFKAHGQSILVTALEEHDKLWFLLISILVHRQNPLDTLPLIQLETRALFIDVRDSVRDYDAYINIFLEWVTLKRNLTKLFSVRKEKSPKHKLFIYSLFHRKKIWNLKCKLKYGFIIVLCKSLFRF